MPKVKVGKETVKFLATVDRMDEARPSQVPPPRFGLDLRIRKVTILE